MNFPDGLFAAPWVWGGWTLYLPVVVLALWRAPWARLRDNVTAHLFLGSCVGVLLLWVLKAGIAPGLNVHLLGATWLTLMFGWSLALLGMSLVLLGATVAGASGAGAFALNALVLAVLPVLTAHGLHRLVERTLPHQVFVYLFASGFFNAAATIATSALAASALLLMSGAYTWQQLADNYLPYALLVAFPEAFVTGAGLSYFVIYHPQRVATFRADVYFGR